MPFYRGTKENVIPVYEHSFYFQGYVAQAFKRFYHPQFSHYLFIGDDLLLNPDVSEKNIGTYLNLNIGSSFIPNLYELHKRDINHFWSRIRLAYEFKTTQEGVEIAKEIPSYKTALKKVEALGLTVASLKFAQVYGKFEFQPNINTIKQNLKKIIKWLQLFPKANQLHLSYPLIGSYSDIFLVSQKNIYEFCHYCGVFAASRLFVEFAIPTAMILSAENIVSEKQTSLQGKALWSKEDYKLLEKFDKNIDLLLTEFPRDWLYVHPIKLSQWIHT
jgi:hypothetical protein